MPRNWPHRCNTNVTRQGRAQGWRERLFPFSLYLGEGIVEEPNHAKVYRARRGNTVKVGRQAGGGGGSPPELLKVRESGGRPDPRREGDALRPIRGAPGARPAKGPGHHDRWNWTPWRAMHARYIQVTSRDIWPPVAPSLGYLVNLVTLVTSLSM